MPVMRIQDFLSSSHVACDLAFADKKQLLDELSARVAAIAKLPPELVAREIRVRDSLGSTGIGRGVAIPHARLRKIDRPIGYLAHLKKPVRYDAIDDQPVDIVFLLLLPAASQVDQLDALAAVARALRNEDVARGIRQAKTRADVYRNVCQA